jgi:hypothetical protein
MIIDDSLALNVTNTTEKAKKIKNFTLSITNDKKSDFPGLKVAN